MTPLDVTVKINWRNDQDFEVIVNPNVDEIKDREWSREGKIVYQEEYDPENYPDYFLSVDDAIEKWTVKDSNIIKDTEFVKYWIDQINQQTGSEYILGNVSVE